MFYFALKRSENHIRKHYPFLGKDYVGAKIKLIANNKIANIGIKIMKKVVLVIYKLKSINANILAKLNNSSGIKINNVITNVITEIDKLNELDITILFILILTFLTIVFFSVIKPSALKSFSSSFTKVIWFIKKDLFYYS